MLCFSFRVDVIEWSFNFWYTRFQPNDESPWNFLEKNGKKWEHAATVTCTPQCCENSSKGDVIIHTYFQVFSQSLSQLCIPPC